MFYLKINDLLKEYDAKFSILENGDRQINDAILPHAAIIQNDNSSFVLQNKGIDGETFELIVKPVNTVIYNFYDPDGELYLNHTYSDEGNFISE